MRKRLLRLLTLVGAALGLALADASDSKTFTVTVSGTESVQIDTGTASLTVDYSNSTYCSAVDRFCAWYPTVIYSTNYATNRKLVASATTTSPILSVVLEKQVGTQYENPFTPYLGSRWFHPWHLGLLREHPDPERHRPGRGEWASRTATYAIAPKLKLVFSSSPTAGTYSATVTFTIMAQ